MKWSKLGTLNINIIHFPIFQGDTPDLDLIELKDNQTEDIIFDPLLEKDSSSNHRPLQRLAPFPTSEPPRSNHATSTLAVHSNSSENLLREYGLDFTQLSIHHPNSSNHINSTMTNLLDELDPLRSLNSEHSRSNHATFGDHSFNNTSSAARPVMAPPPPPVAPPRTKRQSQQTQNNWTTFDQKFFVILLIFLLFLYDLVVQSNKIL